jgi:hypothetical protein
MKKLFFIVLILLFWSCSKEKKVSRELSGRWQLTTYKRTDAEGLISYPTASGEAQFDPYERSADSSTCMINIIPANQVVLDTINQKGTYRLVDKASFMFITEIDSADQVKSYLKYRILTLTRTDLEIEFSRNGNTDILLFQKN